MVSIFHLAVKLLIQLFKWNILASLWVWAEYCSWHSFLRLQHAYLFMYLRYITLNRADRSGGRKGGAGCKLLYLETTHRLTLKRPQSSLFPFALQQFRAELRQCFFFFSPQKIYLSTCALQLTGCRGGRGQCLWSRWFVIRWGSLRLAEYCWSDYWSETGSWIRCVVQSQLW